MKYIFDENNRLIGRTDNLNMTGLEIGTEPPSFNSIHQDCKYINNAWVLVDRDRSSDAMMLLREVRNAKLSESDWRFRSDLTPSQAWIDYCQALRDLPANSTPALDENGQLTGVNWPTPPESE